MSDHVDHDRLYRLAESQAGYFTSEQAQASGIQRSTLRHHARPGGRYRRIQRGLYRLRHFPSSPHEHVMAAWLPLAGTQAVVSHDTALELHGLSDVIPDAVHISVPRASRGRRPRTGVQFHTLSSPPDQEQIRIMQGVPVTTPTRTIVDVLDAGTPLEQIELAIHQALTRGLTTPRRLRHAARTRSQRIQAIIDAALDDAPTQ
jgi:predicted transcriptional regulator of viral defense system